MSTATTPTFEASPDYDLFALVADPTCPVGRDAVQLFLDACKADADSHGGFVSVNRVRERMTAADVQHHRYSSFWSRFVGAGRPMRNATEADRPNDAPDDWSIWEPCKGSPSKNDGRPYRFRIWVGDGLPTFVTEPTGETR